MPWQGKDQHFLQFLFNPAAHLALGKSIGCLNFAKYKPDLQRIIPGSCCTASSLLDSFLVLEKAVYRNVPPKLAVERRTESSRVVVPMHLRIHIFLL